MNSRDNSPLIVVHICSRCGASVQRTDTEGIPNSSGLYRCPVCGEGGPLNLQVRSAGCMNPVTERQTLP